MFIFIGKSDIQRGGETERKIFHPMIHFPSKCNGQCCTDPEPGARNLLQVSHAGTESQSFGPFLTAFPGHKQGAGWEVVLPDLEPVPMWNSGTLRARNLAMGHAVGPGKKFYNKLYKFFIPHFLNVSPLCVSDFPIRIK